MAADRERVLQGLSCAEPPLFTDPAAARFGAVRPRDTAVERLPRYHNCSYIRYVNHIRLHRSVSFAASVGLSAIVLCSPVQTARADWFRWVDQHGVTHLTDRQENIPEEYRGQAAALDIPQTPPPLQAESVSIPLEAEGQVAVVSALLNGRTAASLIVDTGATYTVISYAVAGELQIDVSEDTPVTQLQTANGVITAPVVELESVDVGGMKLNRVKAAVHDLPTSTPVGGLLGLNFLQHFRVDIDTTKRTLSLERRTEP